MINEPDKRSDLQTPRYFSARAKVSGPHQNSETPNIIQRAIYIGTTGHTTHDRQLEHVSSVRRMEMSNALAKHQATHHPNHEAEFSSQVLRGGIQFNLDRFILEAHKIQEAGQNPNIALMNQRSEWGHRGLPRLQITAT